MLGSTYRFTAINNTGVAFGAGDAVTIKAIRWNVDSSGARVAEAPEATVASAILSSVASGSSANGATQDNTAAGAKWLGGDFSVDVLMNTGSPSGTVDIYYEISTDGGTTWPDAGNGELVASIPISAASSTHHHNQFTM